MALLRFRFPWGLVLSTVGFAAVAGAAGWFLLTDLHGHLWLRCALHAGGGAVLGVVAWRLSERLTDWVNLHTSPLLRLGLAAVAAAVIATCATGPFCELGVGAGAIWPEVVCALLFVVAGLAPAIAGVTLIAGLETMLAARRGGGGMVEALRPIGRHLAAGLVLAVATAYAAVELPRHIERAMVALAPDRVRASDWLAGERRLFRSVHADWSCEVLVAPFAAGTPSVDRPARSLITRYVAAELAARSGICVADPTLVARALGSRQRAPADAQVEALAETMNARWVVRGRVTRDPVRHRLSIALRVDERSGPKIWTNGVETQWGPLEFSDELPPEAAFARIAREVAEGLGLELEPADELETAGPRSVALPTTPDALAVAVESPVARARGLQLLAAMHHASDIDGEHLWERSLVALRPLPAEDETARLLRARASLHLYRRPHAAALLEGLASPEAQALLAVTQGNLAQAEPLARAVRDPAGALTLQLEIEALRTRYGKTAGLDERRQVLLDSHPGYSALLYAAMSQADADSGPALALIANELAADGMDARPGPMHALAMRLGLAPGGQTAGLAAAIERGRATVWQTRAAVWRGQPAYDRPTSWDAADVLYAAARGVVTAAARNRVAGSGSSDALVSYALSLGRAYAGYPPLVGSVAAALQADADSGAALQEARARRLPGEVLAWEGGESDTERGLTVLIAAGLPAPEADEPPRPWRPAPGTTGVAMQLARQQAYSQDAFAPLEQAITALERTGLADLALGLREEARLRFIGSPARERFLLRRAEETGDLSAYASVLMERVREQPEDWPTYITLARVYLMARQPAYAQQVLLACPQPEGEAPNAVTATQRAHEAGMLLLHAGEVDLARPLLERAAAGADSPARLWSRIALARLDGNWAQARAQALELHERHRAPGALARAATVAFLLGDEEAGWRGFYEAAKRFEDFGPWAAALAAHRIARTRPADVEAFADRWKSLSEERATETRLKGYFLLNALLVDRAPDAALTEELVGLARKRQDPALAGLVAGYSAFKRADHAAATSRLTPLYDPSTRDPAAYVLPYLVVSLTHTDRTAEAQALVEAARKRAPRDFHALLSTGYLAGAAGRADAALQLLWEAFIALPEREAHMVPAGLQLLEICEQLYAQSSDERYRTLLVDLARRQHQAWPVSWAYTFDARYAPRPDEAEAALGIALFLDPDSAHLRDSGDDRRKRAVARFPTGNPFRPG
jgi:TolB-like protein